MARRLERLEELAKELQSRFPGLNIAIEAADLSVPEAVQTLLRQLEARGLEIDVLVNNAGLSESELFERFRRGAELSRPSKPGPGESEFDQVAGIEGGATPGQGIFESLHRNARQI